MKANMVFMVVFTILVTAITFHAIGSKEYDPAIAGVFVLVSIWFGFWLRGWKE